MLRTYHVRAPQKKQLALETKNQHPYMAQSIVSSPSLSLTLEEPEHVVNQRTEEQDP